MSDKPFRSDGIDATNIVTVDMETNNLKLNKTTQNNNVLITNDVGDVTTKSISSLIIKDGNVNGIIDGQNQQFAVDYEYKPLTLVVYLNGLKLSKGEDFIETGSNNFLMLYPPMVGDKLKADYFTKN